MGRITPAREYEGGSKLETMFVLHDHERLYSEEQVIELLEKALAMGFCLDKGSELEGLTVHQLDLLLNRPI